MNSKDKSARIYAVIGTALIMAACFFVLFNSFMVYPPADYEPTPPTEIVLDEFVEVEDFSALAEIPGEEIPLASASQAEADADGSGDNGGAPAAETVSTHASEALVSSDKPSEVKTPEKPTPSAAEIKAREEEARKKREQDRIKDEVGGAFADSPTPPSPSNSAVASGSAPVGSVAGTSNVGRIGQGWGLPGFGGVVSPSTGTVIVEAKISPKGYVTAVNVITQVNINGREYKSTAPAGTDANVIKACCSEVKSKHFTRTGADDGLGTTAYIVFNFK